jgi:hypothetical protein
MGDSQTPCGTGSVLVKATMTERILSAAFVAGGIPQPPAGIAPVLSERKVWLLWQYAIGGGGFAEPLVRFDAKNEPATAGVRCARAMP